MDLSLGSLVRVPLGARAVRGYVVGISEGDNSGLKEIRAVSGTLPVFDDRLLATIDRLAAHYVAPRAVLLARTVPPNVPKAASHPDSRAEVRPLRSGAPFVELIERARARQPQRPGYFAASERGGLAAADVLAPLVDAGGCAMIMVPTADEAASLAAVLEPRWPESVLLATGLETAKHLTAVWGRTLQSSGWLLVATPRIQLWSLTSLDVAAIVEDGRRAYKERATPTLHAREILLRRSARERFGLIGVGQLPSSELFARGPDLRFRPGRRRAWPAVEIVEHTEPSLISRRSMHAVAGSLARGHRVMLFTARHQGIVKCARCRAVRECQTCGAGGTRSAECLRCGAEMGPCHSCGSRRFQPASAGKQVLLEEARETFGATSVGSAESTAPIRVLTERDLAAGSEFDLAVAVDVDGLLFGTNYRAEEEALRLLARLAASVPERGGRRTIVQTRSPSHRVLAALAAGDPVRFLDDELAERSKFGLPPASDLLVLEVSGETGTFPEELLDASGPAMVMGPAPLTDRTRWLLQGELGPVKQWLRGRVQRLRDQGARVRIDADPLDL